MKPVKALVAGTEDCTKIQGLLEAEGVFDVLGRRGFGELEVSLRESTGPLSHIDLHGSKSGQRYLLFDACITQTQAQAPPVWCHALDPRPPADLLVVYWFREQDPTRSFSPERPRLPLQEHPGLGILRRAFRVVLTIARENGKDGVACLPKYYHDAAIYYRTRLFSFLVAREQGRLEALMRDLSDRELLDATLAVTGGAVRDQNGDTLVWSPGFQVLPLGDSLAEYFNSQEYNAEVAATCAELRFEVDKKALKRARNVFRDNQRRNQ